MSSQDAGMNYKKKMSQVNPHFYDNEGYGSFPSSPQERIEEVVEKEKKMDELNPDMLSCSSGRSNSPASTEEADDESALPLLQLRERSHSTHSSSRRSTPRSIPSSAVHSPREVGKSKSAFDLRSYFRSYCLRCVDINEDVRSVAIASAKLHCLYNFVPDYFSVAPDGLLLNELRQEYEVFLSSAHPSPCTAIRIGQLTEQIKFLLQ